MDRNTALGVVERFMTLTADKRKRYLAMMLEQGVSLANLPIPKGQSLNTQPPLSYAQQRQWFLWQMDPHSAAYHIPVALRLRGVLDLAALRSSFQSLVTRHETLRTTFAHDNGSPYQIVHDHMDCEVHVDTLAVDETPLETAIAAFVDREIQQPFDLLTGPLLRVKLLKLAEDDHVLTVVQHHVVSDGASMQVMVDELMEFYAGYSQGHEVVLAE
ncbi:condensation domain-containing protein, partial [Pseudomonas sp. MAFF 302030]